ncbi:tRNA (mnm(5)s(2)U34)-methyltransferase [Caloramator australicus]|uniref:SAM-dependent methyltransferase, MraW methylase family n=1 Tax=Caloramator australicus RC3 TaxID=857293 RepID=I7J4Z9_9CLOT|nr:class I SAM-dependent methyltransferase [Caloramator australicus]CCJ33316.1 SAM-dependent methyltransferase, MraW methylase family [Caloramator australicus RC3]
MYRIVLKATRMAQDIVKKVIDETDIAVDATLGNGNDTLFLSNLLHRGKVYAFDIQTIAIEKFKKTIHERNIKNVILINDGHENILNYVMEAPKAIMFNLGYLPGGDEKIITRPDTTLKALSDSLKILKPGGVITLVVYTGHLGGAEEGLLIDEFIKKLDPKIYSVMQIKFANRDERAPYLIVIEKNDSYNEDKHNILC